MFVIYFSASAKEPERLVLHYALPYQIVEILPNGEQGQTYVGSSLKSKLAEIATELRANPYPEDQFRVFPEYKDFVGRVITLYRAPSYSIVDQNKETIYRSFSQTVGQLLEEKKIILGDDDKINFSVDTALDIGMAIKIIRVAKTRITEKETIDYKTIKKDDPNLEKGNRRIEQAGKKGEKHLIYDVTRENGVEISRVLLSSEVVTEPVNEIVYIGTKIVSYGSGIASFDSSVSGMVATCNLVSRGTRILVVNLYNGKSVEVVSIGKGLRSDRIIDLSPEAFEALGASIGQGLIQNVRLEKVN